MPVSKATKKFEKNKLGDVIKARKNVAKIKQRKQMDTKKKQRKASDNAKADDLEEDGVKKPKKAKDDNFGDMSMDQFFEGGFDIPKMKKTKSKTGKRKRTPVEEEEDAPDGSSDEEVVDATANGDDESASDSESGDDAETHKRDIEALKEKDPEFYNYLKSNDAELLEFAEDADLDEIDALSASEDETTPRKKQKKAAKADSNSDDESEAATGNEVSKQFIQKWKSAMETKSSLRAMKEVVLAFRSAAHLNDEEGKVYKYSISDPDGTSRNNLAN